MSIARLLARVLQVLKTSLIILLVTEASLRVVNSLYPLERPSALSEKYEVEWLEGERSSRLNGLTHLYVYKPKPDGMIYGHPFQINRWGFRGRDFLERDLEGAETFRIMVLGDSNTMGTGIAEEERYTNVLEKKLRERYPTVQVEVINLGVQGFETVQEEKIMRRMWSTIRPNLTIVGFCVNDPNITYDYYPAYKMPLPEKIRMLLNRSLLFRKLEPLYDRIYRQINHIPTFVEAMQRAYNTESRDWKIFERSVHNIGLWVREHTGQPPAVFLTDAPAALKEGMYQQVHDTFVREGFIWWEVDTGYHSPVSRFESHPNAETHRYLANALFQTIVEQNLVPEK